MAKYRRSIDFGFVKPGQLGTKAEFGKRFVKPLEKGQAVDSTPEDVRVKRFRAAILPQAVFYVCMPCATFGSVIGTP
ncbi:hypothetical protein OUZ56_003658 [Daphnia magna]|uniref:Uncharacterized protein n=1 Tax=Daphnia magna TaxID=35525 RepID=A0ABR0A9L4_9CRUS|nr:hypothetical protein OUZ56_003658 [Daphnia magna]